MNTEMQANQPPRNLYLNNCQNVFIGDNHDVSWQCFKVPGKFTINKECTCIFIVKIVNN